MRFGIVRSLFALLVTVCTAIVAPPARAEDFLTTNAGPIPATDLCAAANPFAIVENVSGTFSPCSLAPRTFVVEALYLQNASRVGGTALAAYPLVSLHAGVVPRVQLTLDLPSEIAESIPGGRGAYPVTHFGFGATYTVVQSATTATAIVTDVMPPNSRFAPTNGQPRYSLGVSSSAAISSRWTVAAEGTGTSSAAYGFGLISPELVVSTGYHPSRFTQFTSDVGTRVFTRHGRAQSFTDVGVDQVLNRKLVFTVGIGTTFNAVSNTKPHYLASGLTFRP
jgi:hypothetical protein